jgi:hypothetical protein
MTTEQAKQVLRDAGYYVDNLWHVNDVMDRFECDEDEAQNVLHEVLHNGFFIEQINYMLDDQARFYYKRKGGDQ